MNFDRITTRVRPKDPKLAERQWAEWRASRRRLLKSGALAGAGIGFMGSGLGFGTSSIAVAQEAEPVLGGSIVMSLADQDVQSLDPAVPTDNMSIWTMLLIYDQLVRASADGFSIEPGLAETWSANDEGLVYTFNLRDASFHDGTAVTASDVAYCIMRAKTLEGGIWGFIFSAIDSIDAPDDKTVLINLAHPWAPLEADLAIFAASIFPQAAHEAQGDALFENPIGSGAFKFVSWDKDQEMVLEKNTEWWDTGKPYLDSVIFKVLPDSNARMLQFQAGELDIVTSIPYNQLDSLRANPEVTVVEDAAGRFDHVTLNTLRTPLDDVRVRQAINYAVDKQAIIDNVLFGAGQIANTFLPPMPLHYDSLPPYPYDVEKAKELIAGTAAEGGFELELLIRAGDAVDAQVGQLVAAALKEIGGKINISQVDGATMSDRIFADEPDFDMALSYYTTDILDPDELATFTAASDGGTKAMGSSYKNEEVDRLIVESQSDLDPENRAKTYEEIQRLVQDDGPYLYLYYPTGRAATSSVVQNFHVLPTGNYRLYEVWRTDV